MPPPPPIPTVEKFTDLLLNSPIKSTVLSDKWSLLSPRNKQKYIAWFYSDRTKRLEDYWGINPPKKIYNKDTGKINIVEETNRDGVLWSERVPEDAVIEYFEKFTKESLGITQDNSREDGMDGGSRRRRRSLPKSSRKYKKSKRVFRKKSRSTRRR